MNEDFLSDRLAERKQDNNLRQLRIAGGNIDFCSNDYLGIASLGLIPGLPLLRSGSTGSRLLRGNFPLVEEAEERVALFHEAQAGLIFNSGYDANLAILSAVPRRGDTILYDYLSHASIRDGIRLSFAESHAFGHNDLDELESKLRKKKGQAFVVTESVFSMDGDFAPLSAIADLCDQYGALLIVDEAHATGVVGDRGEGLVQSLGLQARCFARVHTFGKACGVHGAIVLGYHTMKQFLVNFARPFIYSTALSERVIADVLSSYTIFPGMTRERAHLHSLVRQFQQEKMTYLRPSSTTPIQPVIVPGNQQVRKLADHLQQNGFDIRPILYPTVPKGGERLRIVFHAFNTEEQLGSLLKCLKNSD